MAKKKLTTVLVKPTGADCNLDCGYCFYLDRAGTPRPGFKQERGLNRLHGRRMSDEVLEAMVRQVMRGGSAQVSFGWQGGEPLLMGLDFFKRAVEYERRYGFSGQVVGNGLQTNGTLINDAWGDLFLETNWLVGLSLDGPPHIHDHYRRTRNGRGTYERVRAVAELLSRRGVLFNVLTVVNEYSVRFPKEIYDHHKQLGLRHMQFIPCVEQDPRDPRRAADFSVGAEQLGRFMCEVFDLWRKDFVAGRPTVDIRWFDSFFHAYVDRPAPECTLMKECGCYVVVEHNGDVFPCDFFVEDRWKLGNVLTGDLTEMLNSSKQKVFGQLKAKLPRECRTCRWLKYCRGGCTKDRLRDPTDEGSNHFCRAFMMFFEHADAEFRRLAEEWKAEQRAAAARRNAPCPCGSGKRYKHCCEKKARQPRR